MQLILQAGIKHNIDFHHINNVMKIKMVNEYRGTYHELGSSW